MEKKTSFLAFLPVMLTFFTMGFVDLVGAASNHVQADLGLTESQTYFIPSLVFFWFLIFSVPTSALMNRIGRKNTVLVSLAVTLLSLVLPLFGNGYYLMLVAFSLLGIGNAIMQTSLNPLVTNLISGDKLAATLTFGQFVKAIASFMAPIIMTWGAVELALFPGYHVPCGNRCRNEHYGTETAHGAFGLDAAPSGFRYLALLHFPYDRLFQRVVHPAFCVRKGVLCYQRIDDRSSDGVDGRRSVAVDALYGYCAGGIR